MISGKCTEDQLLLNDKEDIERTWKKIEHKVKMVALGDGLSSGKEIKFQDYFDQGYFAGFCNGYTIGRIKGSLFARQMQEHLSIEEHELLRQPKMAWCQLCVTNQLLNETISEVKAHQTEIQCKNLNKLKDINVDITE